MRVEVYTRAHCAPCDRLAELLEEVQAYVPFSLTFIDIDQRPELRKALRYDIPAVFINGIMAFRHRVEKQALLDRLRREAGTSVADV